MWHFVLWTHPHVFYHFPIGRHLGVFQFFSVRNRLHRLPWSLQGIVLVCVLCSGRRLAQGLWFAGHASVARSVACQALPTVPRGPRMCLCSSSTAVIFKLWLLIDWVKNSFLSQIYFVFCLYNDFLAYYKFAAAIPTLSLQEYIFLC